MKEIFWYYYNPTEKDFKRIWSDGLIVFDTNVLLDLYRRSQNTRKESLSTIEHFRDQVWLPHQVGEEFFRNREQIILEACERYDKELKRIKEVEQAFRSKYNPFIRPSLLKHLTTIEKDLQNSKRQLERLIKHDIILEQIESIFEGRIGAPFPESKLEEIYKVGKARYAQKVPPGFADREKEGPDVRRYGDLVWWFQTIEEITSRECPLIIVTRDTKEDWWIRRHGKTQGPRIELRKELMDKTGQDMWMYRLDEFLKYAKKERKQKVSPETVEEIKGSEFTVSYDVGQIFKSFVEAGQSARRAVEALQAANRSVHQSVLEAVVAPSLQMEEFGESVKFLQRTLFSAIAKTDRKSEESEGEGNNDKEV